MDTFDLEAHEYIELCNLLKVTGMCDSGGMAKSVINAGMVKVDHQVEYRKRCKLGPGQVVEFQAQTVRLVKNV